MAEERWSFFGFLRRYSRLFGRAQRQTLTPKQPSAPDFAQELEKALEAVKSKESDLRKGSLMEPLHRRKLTGEERRADRMRAMEEAHERIRKDILALHRNLGTGLDEGDLAAARDHLLEMDEIIPKGQQGRIEERIRAAVATRLLTKCAPLAWQSLLTLMEKKGFGWPDPMGLSPWDDGQALTSARARELAEARHEFVSSPPRISSDRIFGIVKAWKTEYSTPDSSPWKRLVIEAVGHGITGYLVLTASQKLSNEPGVLKEKIAELLSAQVLLIQTALKEGIGAVSDAEDLIIRATQVYCGVVPEVAWDLVEKFVHGTAQRIAEGAELPSPNRPG